MKKIVQVLSAAVITIGATGSVALADSSISNTGPNSYNWILNKETNKVTITCDNNVDVVNINNQSANSGTAEVEKNTNSGNATSGDASNINEVVVDMNIGCAPVQQTSTTPPSGGQGSGSQPAPAPAPATAPAALPSTGSSSPAAIVGVSTVVVASLAIGSRAGSSLYRKLF